MIKDRQGHIVKELEGQNKLLKKLYSTSAGRCALKILVSPFVTHLGRGFIYVFTIFKDKYFLVY